MNKSTRKLFIRNSGAEVELTHRAKKLSPTFQTILASRRNHTEADENPKKSVKYLIKKGGRTNSKLANSADKENSKANETSKFWDKVAFNQPQWCLPFKISNSLAKPGKTTFKQQVYALKSGKLMKRKLKYQLSDTTDLNITNIRPTLKTKENLRESLSRDVKKYRRQTHNSNSKQKNTSNRYEVLEQKIIGAGTFGKVYMGKICATGQNVAIKRAYIDMSHKSRQIQLMEAVNSEYVIKLIDKFTSVEKIKDETKQFINMVMPKYESSFYDFLRPKHYSVKPNLLKIYLYQILRGVLHLHSKGICHRDLKPQNILISKNKLVICDLGSAKILKKEQQNIAYICSRCYRAPQLIFGCTGYGLSIDMWSVGCIILEILNKGPFFIAKDSLHHLIEIMKVMGTPTVEQILSMNPHYQIEFSELPTIRKTPWKDILKTNDPQLIDLIQKIMLYDPHARLTAYEALCHPYFSNIDSPQFISSISEEFDCRGLFVFNSSTGDHGTHQ